MFGFKEKMEYINKEKTYVKKGKEKCYPIGRIVKIDWDFQSNYLKGVKTISDLDKKVQQWINKCNEFVVTDVFHWALSSTVTLDHMFEVSVFLIYDAETKEYLFHFEDIDSIRGKYCKKGEKFSISD